MRVDVLPLERVRLADARRELHAAIGDAYAEGAGMATIARTAGLSRERIRQIAKA